MKEKQFTILFVDDESDIREEMEMYLRNISKEFYLAENGVEGLKLFKEKKPDLILSDIVMPKMNGLEMSEEIRNICSDVPIILLTGNSDAEFFKKAIDLSIDKYINKPINLKLLNKTINQITKNLNTKLEIKKQATLLEQYKETVDMSSIVSKTDVEGNITYVNEQFCLISGYKDFEILGKKHNLIKHPDMDAKIYTNLWKTIKRDKKPWYGEIKNKKKDGTHYWVDTTINPILDHDNNIIEFIALRRDITHEVQMRDYFKNELNITYKQFSSALNISKEYEKAINESTVVSRTDASGKIIYVNDQYIDISGFSKEELIGKTNRIVRHPDNPNKIFEDLWDVITSGQIWHGVLKNQSKNKKPYWINTTIVPIINENKKIIEYMAISNNVTEIFYLHSEIENTQKDVIYKMGQIGETRSQETGNHVKRVANYSKILAKLYGLDDKKVNLLYSASPMHDIGKVGIPDSILNKPGKLNDEEWEIMKTHTQIGKEVLSGSLREVLNAARVVAYEHHEKWDGSGYPRGLEGESIHIFGRITALADVFDALGSNRCYKKTWSDEKIFKLFKEERGKHFEPRLVDLFFENLDMFLNIRNKFKD